MDNLYNIYVCVIIWITNPVTTSSYEINCKQYYFCLVSIYLSRYGAMVERTSSVESVSLESRRNSEEEETVNYYNRGSR